MHETVPAASVPMVVVGTGSVPMAAVFLFPIPKMWHLGQLPKSLPLSYATAESIALHTGPCILTSGPGEASGPSGEDKKYWVQVIEDHFRLDMRKNSFAS